MARKKARRKKAGKKSVSLAPILGKSARSKKKGHSLSKWCCTGTVRRGCGAGAKVVNPLRLR